MLLGIDRNKINVTYNFKIHYKQPWNLRGFCEHTPLFLSIYWASDYSHSISLKYLLVHSTVEYNTILATAEFFKVDKWNRTEFS